MRLRSPGKLQYALEGSGGGRLSPGEGADGVEDIVMSIAKLSAGAISSLVSVLKSK
jgi:hypothetical protein